MFACIARYIGYLAKTLGKPIELAVIQALKERYSTDVFTEFRGLLYFIDVICQNYIGGQLPDDLVIFIYFYIYIYRNIFFFFPFGSNYY